jgi:chaperone modulatory protein CbpM
VTPRHLQILTGELLDESLDLDLEDFCRYCHLEQATVIEMVTEGVIDPSGEEQTTWRFTGLEVRRAQIALRLTRELEVNLPGAALALDLLEEVEKLRRRLPDL